MAFDIDTYVRHSAPLVTEDLDFEVYRDNPLDEDTLRCLRYMHDVEFHTVCYLRDLLVTRAHNDPEVTTFLTFWAYEEHFHGDAIAKILDVHDEINGRERVQQTRTAPAWKNVRNSMTAMLGSLVIKDLTAIHMTWGAVNEWVTQAGYARLSAQANNPHLKELLQRIMKQEGRHIDFYSTQAAKRLENSPMARKLTRFALTKFWGPVGSTVMPREEVSFMTRHLFNGEDGFAIADRIDRRIDRLPGLKDLGLVRNASINWAK